MKTMKPSRVGDLVRIAMKFVPDHFFDDALQALIERDFETYFSKFDSHRRLELFDAIKTYLTDQEYWTVLRSVWMFEEVFFRRKILWKRLISSRRPRRECFMSVAERKALEKMPAEIEIFRGYTGNGIGGLSWTVSKQKARWFAEYANSPRMQWLGVKPQPAKIASGKCLKADVYAYVNARKEREIIINPAKIYAVTTRLV